MNFLKFEPFSGSPSISLFYHYFMLPEALSNRLSVRDQTIPPVKSRWEGMCPKGIGRCCKGRNIEGSLKLFASFLAVSWRGFL